MHAAINTLEIDLQTHITNEPIRRAEGNIERADQNARCVRPV